MYTPYGAAEGYMICILGLVHIAAVCPTGRIELKNGRGSDDDPLDAYILNIYS